MKANTPELMKFKRLQRRLGESRRGIIGLLEGLWIETARNCPEGDIGRFANEEIAIMVDWDGDPDELVDALVECRWLDECDDNRIVVHDWSDHCPKYVKGGLARQGKVIAIATSLADQGTSSKVQAIGTTLNAQATTPELPTTKLSQAKLSQAKPSERQVQPHSLSCRESEYDGFQPEVMVSKHMATPEFQSAWKLWTRKQSIGNGRAMDGITEQAQLYDLERFSTSEAIEVVRFSTSRTTCRNLILNGDHKAKPASGGTGGRRTKVSFEEGLLK